MLGSTSSTTERLINCSEMSAVVNIEWLSGLIPIQSCNLSRLRRWCVLNLAGPVERTIWTAGLWYWTDNSGNTSVFYGMYFASWRWLIYWLWSKLPVKSANVLNHQAMWLCSSPCGIAHHLANSERILRCICKMYFSHWKPPGVSERMWSVKLEASISGGYQTLGGHSGCLTEQLGSLITGTVVIGISADWYRRTMGVIVISLEARRSARENLGCTWHCHWTNAGITNTLWEMAEILWIIMLGTAGGICDFQHYMSNGSSSTANTMHGLLFIITSESY